MFVRAREWNGYLHGRWTFHAAMSLLTTSADGSFTRFGRVYWWAHDRIKSAYVR